MRHPGIMPHLESERIEEEILRIKAEIIKLRKDCLLNDK